MTLYTLKKMKQTDFSKQLADFLSVYLPHERNMSPNTISTYRDTFVHFLSFMLEVKGKKAEKVSLSDISKDNVLEFLKWLMEKKGNSISTRNNRLAAIHAFVAFLQYECIDHIDQWQQVLSIKAMKKERSIPIHFSREGIKAILNQPDSDDHNGIRHLAILEVMYDTGCRVQELIDLKVGFLRIQTSPCSIKIIGKGRKARIVPLSDAVVATLRKYLESYRINTDVDSDKSLFLNKYGGKLTRAGVTYILQKYADDARQENADLIPTVVSCHQLRHSRAMNLQEEGVNLVWIRDLLGHESVQTTEIYARTASKQRQEAIAKASETLNPNPEIGAWINNKNLLSWLKGLGKK